MSKADLTKQLAVLLGFEDGADDVLEHLLTIESSKVGTPTRRNVFSTPTFAAV